MANELTMSPLASPVAGQRSNPLATFLLVVYAFLVISRIFEFLALLGVGRLRLVLITSLLGLLLALPSGGLIQALKSRPGICLILFTGWLMMATATSAWRGGSARMLKDQWAVSLVSFALIAGLAVSYQQLRKTVSVMAVGTLVAAGLTSLLGRYMGGRFELEFGSLGNANQLAFHLLYGAPLCLYCLRKSGLLLRGFWVAVLGLLVYTVLLTGSRGGLVILAALFAMMLLEFSWMNRLMIVMAGLVVVSGLGLVPRVVKERYRTIFMSQEDVDNPVAASAVESRESRRVLLRDSLIITFQHPLLGGGPGLFQVVSADYATSQGEKAMWQQTHNAYTQVSSECGIPALILFVGLLGWIFQTLRRVGKAARVVGNHDVRNLAFSLMMMLTALALYCLFDSIAYQYYLPILAGLTLSLDASTRHMLVRAAVPAQTDASASLRGTSPGRQPGRNFPGVPGTLGRPKAAPALRESARRSL